MRNSVVFILVGSLLVVIRNIDLSRGVFLLHGPVKDVYDEVFFVTYFIFPMIVTLLFPLKKRLHIFFYVSIVSMIDHVIWWNVIQAIPFNDIPIEGSWPFFVETYHRFLEHCNEKIILLHIMSGVISYLFFSFMMLVVLRIQAVKAVVKEYLRNKNV